MIRKISLLSLLAAFALGVFGCSGPGSSPTGTSEADRTSQLTALQEKRQNYEASLKAMTPEQLTQSLEADAAKEREPFNSAVYREIVSRGAAAAPALKAKLAHRDNSSFLALLALRQVDREQYQSLDPNFRVDVLVGALKNAKYFNAFGVPMMYWEDPARAIIDEGQAATDPLTALLEDKRPAPVFGSEGTIVNRQYHYRVADYAWALLSEIRHQKVTLATDPAERDQQFRH